MWAVDASPAVPKSHGQKPAAARSCHDRQHALMRSHRRGWREHVISWLGWYPWRCSRCRTRLYLRKSFW